MYDFHLPDDVESQRSASQRMREHTLVADCVRPTVEARMLMYICVSTFSEISDGFVCLLVSIHDIDVTFCYNDVSFLLIK